MSKNVFTFEWPDAEPMCNKCVHAFKLWCNAIRNIKQFSSNSYPNLRQWTIAYGVTNASPSLFISLWIQNVRTVERQETKNLNSKRNGLLRMQTKNTCIMNSLTSWLVHIIYRQNIALTARRMWTAIWFQQSCSLPII